MKTTSSKNESISFYKSTPTKHFYFTLLLLVLSISSTFSQFSSEILIDNSEHYNRFFVVDVDKDSDKDIIAFVNNSNYNFIWIENLGSGNFSKHIIPTSYDGGPPDIQDMIVLDIEKDGYPDIMFSLKYTINNKQLQRINNYGGGNFSTNFAWLTWTGNFDTPETLITEDINKDGYPDILMSDADIDFSVIYKNVNGNFNFWVGENNDAKDFTCGYFNNDTLLDVAFHSFDGYYTWVYYNNNTSFSKSLFNHSAHFGDMDNYDYDRDGDNDLVIANTTNSGWLQNLNNNGFSNTFSSWIPANKINLDFISNPQYKDIIYSSGGGITWISDSATQTLTTTLLNIITDIKVADFNKDGRKDILACSSGGNNHRLVWFKNMINCSTASSINVSSCNSYTSPSGNYNWTNSGTYNDTIQNNSGCDSIIVINLTINTIDTSVSANIPIFTSNQSNANYQWVDCNNNYSFINGATNQSYTATANGSYAVIITNNGCTDTSLCYQINATDINALENKIINIYPNPTTGLVLINLGDVTSIATITIKNIIGQIVSKETIYNKQTHEIEITGNAGVYFIEISIGSDVETFKLFKN